MSLIKRIFSTESADRRLSIAFLDTGVSPVEDFILPENRIVAFRDFINGKMEPYDDNGHGTHVTCQESNNRNFKRAFTVSDERPILFKMLYLHTVLLV